MSINVEGKFMLYMRFFVFLVLQSSFTSAVVAYFGSAWEILHWQGKVTIAVYGTSSFLGLLFLTMQREKKYIEKPVTADEVA